jgi:DNA-3-methyladenine glycosylase I
VNNGNCHCAGALNLPSEVHYHDRESGVPRAQDHRLFDLLILEGAPAELSCRTILNKRAGY